MNEAGRPTLSTEPTIDVHWPLVGIAHVILGGEHDLSNVQNLHKLLTETLGWCSQMVVDLRRARFVDSSTLQALVWTRARARASNRRFNVVVAPRSLEQRSLEITNALESLGSVETLEEALSEADRDAARLPARLVRQG